MFTEPIFKGVDTSTKDFKKKWENGKIKESDLEQYEFTIEKDTINYLGTWHFDTGLVSFSDDKESFDKEIMENFINLDFEKAVTNLPN